jgi:hypothetical protein
MFIFLFATAGLVAWALHLMQEAVERREFGLMLAGMMIVGAAGAMVAVYALTSSYSGYFDGREILY